jgi:hypothetical protein
MTFNKEIVLVAANRTARAIRTMRKEKLDAWNARFIFIRFLLDVFGGIHRPDCYGETWEEIAERIAFKATFCTEETIELSDHEIDVIREWWLIEETLA